MEEFEGKAFYVVSSPKRDLVRSLQAAERAFVDKVSEYTEKAVLRKSFQDRQYFSSCHPDILLR
jgi:hypothetical protein